MKNKSILGVGLICLCFLLSLAGNVKQFISGLDDAQRIQNLSQNTVNGQAVIVTKYVHDSIEHVVIKEVPVKTTSEKNIAVGSGYMDTLTHAIKVAANRIDEVTNINAKLIAENISLRKSVIAGRYDYQDKWLSLSFSPDSNLLDVNYNVSLNTAKYWKRKWLLASKQYFVDLFADDPRIEINSVKRYTLAEQRPKRFGVGFSAGYNYIPFLNKWSPTLGFGLNYNIIEF